jgi:hypothetical protein
MSDPQCLRGLLSKRTFNFKTYDKEVESFCSQILSDPVAKMVGARLEVNDPHF